MHAESGHSLDGIIYRKEIERELNSGCFIWAVGNSLTPVFRSLDHEEAIPALFVKMISKPKDIDVNPGNVLVWTAGRDCFGKEYELPPWSLVLSRASTHKKKNYALVCSANKPISLASDKVFDIMKMRNFSSGNKVGASQVTFAASANSVSEATGTGKYNSYFSCELVPPYWIELTGAISLPLEMQSEINSCTEGMSRDTS